MIKVEPCKGCGKWIFKVDLMGVTIKAEPTPLDAQAAVAALSARLELWAVRHDSTGRPLSLMKPTPGHLAALNAPTRPVVVAQHRCPNPSAPARGPEKAAKGSEVAEAPKGRPAATETASWGRSGPGRAPSAGRRRTEDPLREAPKCSNCAHPMADGTYAAIEVGDLVMWAAHVDACA